jgi:Iap family predicted aminopeptidase
LRVGGRFVPGLTERNVVAELRGQSEEAIVVSAHYDSVWRGPGVIDNATGVEGVRRIAENLAGHGHMRSLIFIAFAAEEIGCIGSRSWIFDSEGHRASSGESRPVSTSTASLTATGSS